MVKKYFAAGVFFSFCLVFWGRTLTLGSKISLPGSKRVKTMRLPFVFQEERDPLWRLMIRRITLRMRIFILGNPEVPRNWSSGIGGSVDIVLKNPEAVVENALIAFYGAVRNVFKLYKTAS
ncbi:hypothetical protein DY000_02022085 [Brassica cretica]|uniref:Uncharacterized protein n=1 Tax=Brassica cretica TaxID=69181 RepID=A0ABQ7DYW9_BRACR|nr:hypothetical protein DY000_02022085 [Brassica cretica]